MHVLDAQECLASRHVVLREVEEQVDNHGQGEVPFLQELCKLCEWWSRIFTRLLYLDVLGVLNRIDIPDKIECVEYGLQ